jgi:pimeloyl-ACP methyl ester carboxylesterase
MYMSYRQDLLAIQKKLSTGSQLIQTASGLLETACIGNGPAVLISHGVGGGYDMGLWLASLIGGEYHFIAPSRFGYLRTPITSNPAPENQAGFYAALLDESGIKSSLIIGLSAGGLSALQFALRYPEQCNGIIMLSAISRSLPPVLPLLRAIYPLMLRSDFIPWMVFALFPALVFRGNGIRRPVLAQVKRDEEKMKLLNALYQTTFPVSLRREGMINDMQQDAILRGKPYPIENIVAPTLVVHAIDDPVVPYEIGEYTAKKIPSAKFIKVKEGGHFCCVTNLEEIIPVMRDFLYRNAHQGSQ